MASRRRANADMAAERASGAVTDWVIHMLHSPIPTPDRKSKAAVTGTVVASVPEFVLVTDGKRRKAGNAPSGARASSYPRLLARSASPAFSREAVFNGDVRRAYSYSVDPTDVSRVVRAAADGRRTVGKLIGDRFVPDKAV